MSDVGFAFWGVFAACAITIGGYAIWVAILERRGRRRGRR